MNRREFLRNASLFAAAGLLTRSIVLAQHAGASLPPTPPAPGGAGITEFRPLRRNVGLFTGRGGTIGWLASKESLVVVDTQFSETAALCIAGLPGRGNRMIDVVLNTHHHGDHVSGNGAFKPVTKAIVAQQNVPKLQFAAAQRAEKDGKAKGGLAQQVYADTTFAEVWRHEFPDEVVIAQYHGPAHTSGDAIILFEKANVVHMGDLVFNRMYPVIDRPAGASVRNWIKVLEEAHKTYPADAIYIFGHANPKFGVSGKRGDLLVMRDYWSAVLEYVQKQIAAGKSRQEIAALPNLPGFPDFHSTPAPRLRTGLEVAFDELTEKSGQG